MNGRDILYINSRKFARQFIENVYRSTLIYFLDNDFKCSPTVDFVIIIRRFFYRFLSPCESHSSIPLLIIGLPDNIFSPLLTDTRDDRDRRPTASAHPRNNNDWKVKHTRVKSITRVYNIRAVLFSFLFFTPFLLFGRAREHLDRCQAVAANEWRADCTFNEPVVSGTSHGYHRLQTVKIVAPSLFSL